MSSTKPTTPRARPVASAPPTSPRTEENQGYRRGRAIRSCLECRRRKMRCNRSRPCQNCNRFCRECVYLPFPEWPSGASSHTKEQGALQGPVRGGGRAFPSFDSPQNSVYGPLPPFNNQDYGYDSDTLAKHDRINDVDADDDFSDVALQIGRLSITEKTGDFFRPHIACQVSIILFSSEYQNLCPCHGLLDSIPSPALTVKLPDCYTSFPAKSHRGPLQPSSALWFTFNSIYDTSSSTGHSSPSQASLTP